jgi:preprotein translocase SecE subunit
MKGYRDDQGRLARMAAFWTITLLLLFGCNFLFEQLLAFGSLQDPIAGYRIPIVSVDLSPAFLISSVVFLIGLAFIFRWQQKPKVADLLIDTEAELKKVTWPTMDEVINSSIIVVIFVLFLGAYLAGADYLLSRVMRYIILGGV